MNSAASAAESVSAPGKSAETDTEPYGFKLTYPGYHPLVGLDESVEPSPATQATLTVFRGGRKRDSVTDTVFHAFRGGQSLFHAFLASKHCHSLGHFWARP